MTHPNQSDLSHFKSEGDINLSSQRLAWQAEHIEAQTQALLDDDARY
ncbi:MAG: aspartate aminotransferase family protein, partial [Chloroflexi bacterium]|nr:aspartate aminotransferase family protein [Chloroflexota bacterium]